jgi:hypothetical protein
LASSAPIDRSQRIPLPFALFSTRMEGESSGWKLQK